MNPEDLFVREVVVQAAPSPGQEATTPTADRALLDRYCVACHSDALRTAGLTLQGLDVTDVGQAPAVWEKVLGKRVLYHPHVNEQPFTRSLHGVKIPPGVGKVTVEAEDSVEGWGGKTRQVQIPR